MPPITISIPDLPEDPSKLAQDEIYRDLLALVGAKSQLSRALRQIRRSLDVYEKNAKTSDQSKLLADLEVLKKLVTTEEAKSLLLKK